MLQIQKDTSFSERGLLFGIVEVIFPQPSEWDETGFAALKERELAALFAEFREYDRKAVFGENTAISRNIKRLTQSCSSWNPSC